MLQHGQPAHDYEWNTGGVIAEAFAGSDPLEVSAVLVRGHGPFAWGASAEKAVENAFVLEEVAEMALKTFQLVAQAEILPLPLRDKHFLRKHGAWAYYGQG